MNNKEIPSPPAGHVSWVAAYDFLIKNAKHEFEKIQSYTILQAKEYAFAELLAARPTKAEVLDIMTIVYEPKKVSHAEYETGKNVIKKLQSIAVIQ